MNTYQLIYTFEVATNEIWSLAFHPKGKVLAEGSQDDKVRFYEVESKKVIAEI